MFPITQMPKMHVQKANYPSGAGIYPLSFYIVESFSYLAGDREGEDKAYKEALAMRAALAREETDKDVRYEIRKESGAIRSSMQDIVGDLL